MGKYYVDFSLEITVSRVIEASNEKEAEEIADKMVFENDGFRECLFDDMSGEIDSDLWSSKNVVARAYGKAPDSEPAANDDGFDDDWDDEFEQ